MLVLVMSGWLRFCLSMFCSVPGFIPLAFTNLEASFCPSSVSVLNKQDRGLTGDRLTLSIPPTARLWLPGAHPWRALEDWTVGKPEGIQRVSPASHFVDEGAGAQREREAGSGSFLHSINIHQALPCSRHHSRHWGYGRKQ